MRAGDRAAGEVDPGGMLRASGEASEREVARPAAHVEHRSRIEALTIASSIRPVIGAPTPRRRARDALCTAHSSKQHGSGRAGSSTISVAPRERSRQPASRRRGAVDERVKSLVAALSG